MFVWSEKEGKFSRRVEAMPVTETVVPLSVEHKEEETITEIPYVMKMYPSGWIKMPSWIGRVLSFQFVVSLIYEGGMINRCVFNLCTIECQLRVLALTCLFQTSRVND